MQESETASHARRVWRLPVILALLAVAVRFALIKAYPDGRDDLAIYTYFGRMMAHGLNPYLPPLDSPIPRAYANIAPFNLGFFAAVLTLWDSPTALRVAFALVDGLIVLVIGYAVRRTRAWRAGVMTFYAFNPLVLMALVVISEDKVVVFLLTILILVSVEKGQGAYSLFWTTILTLYRWLGAFFVLPVAVTFAKTWRRLILYLGFFGLVYALSHVPYWPANLFAYESRAARTLINPPIHDSPTMLLAAVGLYTPEIVSIGILLTLAILYSLFLWRKITLVEVIVLSSFFTTMLSPELPSGRIIMVSLPLFWLITLNKARLIVLWATTIVVSPLANPYETDIILGALHVPIHFTYPSVAHMLMINILPAVLLCYYVVDKSHGRVPRTTLLPDDWLLARQRTAPVAVAADKPPGV